MGEGGKVPLSVKKCLTSLEVSISWTQALGAA